MSSISNASEMRVISQLLKSVKQSCKMAGHFKKANFFDMGVKHLAVIPDGNRRWAKERNEDKYFGHSYAFNNLLPRLIDGSFDRNVHTFTIWLFSTENWKREQREVDYLMEIYTNHLKYIGEVAQKYGARVSHMGRNDRIPEGLKKALYDLIDETSENENHIINIALDYGGIDEIERAAKKGGCIKDNLDTSGQPFPNPDLIVRTSGEQRLSGFMSYQASYSEFLFSNFHFPEFEPEKLDQIADEFASRERRFGK